MYNTIGKCEDCGHSLRFLQFVDFSESGIEQIALCAHGCDDMRSIAYPPEEMVSAAIQAEIERLKKEERKVKGTLNEAVRSKEMAAIALTLNLCEQIGKRNQDGRMEEEDWVRIIKLSNRMEHEIRQAIDQYEVIPQSVSSMKMRMQLEQQERFYKELGRYAVGQAM